MDVSEAFGLTPQAASDQLVAALAASADPVLAYRASLLAGLRPQSAEATAMRSQIANSPMAQALLRVFEQDAKTRHHTYRKWQGPHWTLTCLAMIDYPPADQRLRPLVRQVHDWMFSKHFLESPLTAIYPGQADRVRHCASMDGNAIWYSVRLGLEEDRTRELVDRLIGWQWPDGGWNCDKRLEASHSSFQESLIPARGLWAYGTAHDYAPALEAAQRVADLVLQRRLLWHHSDGSLIVPEWSGKPGPDRIHYPIQFFDVLFALQVMADLGRLDDPRCADALALLEAKRLPDGGFSLEAPTTTTAAKVTSRGSYADWGPSGLRTSNPLVTLAVLDVMRHAADRPSLR
ncbi:hypothetical protein [Propionicimonas sp.]|uniref:hypothetical protein n=1 Tax=Propionicimonas sp. TaxID=1955623 RepID=UPI0017A51B1B|nr:hypothetical protein [Propionicimonas sp.]MBU3975910.1 hypothetical protein [Actinomycetota bacterium]MBA3019691.1 hypothetical protein [Propionicimonas sp.]MBU3987581.1 hypothetical protein [Actinomycetota bacterium]MBU4006448.1 hypothetical protein [Actinomycetota bacterium]MBU4066664.1 hypothetical protein [Actinomycetota bacterium]